MPGAVRAQHGHAGSGDSTRSAMLGAQAVVSGTRLVNAIEGRTLAEGYVSQPTIMGHASMAGGHVAFTGTLNFEGLTLQRGELLGGVYGEGYVDRRHPHTLVHEAVVALLGGGSRALSGSIAGGKGFVPFGTDDPMMRPFERYPVNHHLAQILERAIVVAAVRAPHTVFEVATFGGDEPVGPYESPRWSRFGDSWAARATFVPNVPALELSASMARVRSPESRDLGGLDQRKWSAAARWAMGAPLGGADPTRTSGSYALAEWAMTDNYHRGRRVTVPGYREVSLLAEGGVRRRSVELAARIERSDRPEEERLVDPFRSVRPAPDVSALGLTRWRTITLGVSRPTALGSFRAAPFAEATWLTPRPQIANSLFDPATFYGARRLFALTAGVRLGVGARHARMGRYGVAAGGHRASSGGAAMDMPNE
jgi:hypothetical protein